jgi:hypothetical protein
MTTSLDRRPRRAIWTDRTAPAGGTDTTIQLTIFRNGSALRESHDTTASSIRLLNRESPPSLPRRVTARFGAIT